MLHSLSLRSGCCDKQQIKRQLNGIYSLTCNENWLKTKTELIRILILKEFGKWNDFIPLSKKAKQKKVPIITNVNQYEDCFFDLSKFDWVNVNNSEQVLSGYVVPKEILRIISHNINTQLE